MGVTIAGELTEMIAQLQRLAMFIMVEFPGEVSPGENIIDTAIRLLRAARGDSAGLVAIAAPPKKEAKP